MHSGCGFAIAMFLIFAVVLFGETCVSVVHSGLLFRICNVVFYVVYGSVKRMFRLFIPVAVSQLQCFRLTGSRSCETYVLVVHPGSSVRHGLAVQDVPRRGAVQRGAPRRAAALCDAAF